MGAIGHGPAIAIDGSERPLWVESGCQAHRAVRERSRGPASRAGMRLLRQQSAAGAAGARRSDRRRLRRSARQLRSYGA
jgi:hypothetical protein